MPEPSVFAHQMIQQQPYTFLDEAPAEERRVRNVALRRTMPAEDAAAFGALDAAAIAQVVEDATPPMRDADELHDALLQLVLLREDEVPAGPGGARSSSRGGWRGWSCRRGASWCRPSGAAPCGRSSRTRRQRPPLPVLEGDRPVEREAAVLQVVRGRMEMLGPTTARRAGAARLPGRVRRELRAAPAGEHGRRPPRAVPPARCAARTGRRRRWSGATGACSSASTGSRWAGCARRSSR